MSESTDVSPMETALLPCRLYLIRHGATAHNLLDPPRMQGRHIDEPLAPLGQRQAACVATALTSRPITTVYSSPLRRAMETAAAIAHHHDLQPKPIEALVEVDVGEWEDHSWVEIRAQYAETYQAFRENPVEQGYPGGENLADAARRVTQGMEQLLRDHPGEEIVVVAHSVVNRLLVGELLRVPLQERRRVPQENCAISEIIARGEKIKLITLNAMEHLRSLAT